VTAARALLLVTLPSVALAAPAKPAAEARYEGPRFAFSMPGGSTVKDSTDIAADYAVDVTLPASLELPQVSIRILGSNNKVADLDVEAIGSAWRDARIRNRASWGVKKKTEERVEVTHIGSRRFVRLVDQMGSVLGASSQLMLCGSVSNRLVCGVASGMSDKLRIAEPILVRMLETITVKKPRS
jgi:hypothetical protein